MGLREADFRRQADRPVRRDGPIGGPPREAARPERWRFVQDSGAVGPRQCHLSQDASRPDRRAGPTGCRSAQDADRPDRCRFVQDSAVLLKTRTGPIGAALSKTVPFCLRHFRLQADRPVRCRFVQDTSDFRYTHSRFPIPHSLSINAPPRASPARCPRVQSPVCSRRCATNR